MDKKNWIQNCRDSIREKIKKSQETVRNAPTVFKNRIYLICGMTTFCIVLAVLSALISLIPAATALRGIAVIALVFGIYFAMALPQYMYAAENYVVVAGEVIAVKQKESAKNAAKNLARDIVMDRRKHKTLTVAVKGFSYNSPDNEGFKGNLELEDHLKLQVPDTYFIPIVAGHCYHFYYIFRPAEANLAPYGVESFLFAKEDADIPAARKKTERKEDFIG